MSKAFDSRWPPVPIKKLEAYQFSEEAPKISAIYFSPRKKRIRLGSETSQWTDVKRGCPQGPTFGPFPYKNKTMGMIWQGLGHMWPICGNGMGRLSDDMELIWNLILAKCNLWKIYGKKSRCFSSYGRAMATQCP